MAKYATKGAESAGTVDRPIRHAGQIAGLKVTEHARRMIYPCSSPTDPCSCDSERTCSAIGDTSPPSPATTRSDAGTSDRPAPSKPA
ncbi:hypothetical protein ACIBK9_02355 [Nonomuraea sp. NPDC050227]|uniref:hypothetical protein n=1 Tax=Nonomuraea sp. NPDC050227 TaxID=3364360 RepID=UPI00379D5E2F